MSETKFTKGEWHCIDGTIIGEQVLFVHATELGVNKGIVCRLTKQVDTHISLSLEDIANAHLIAAAPDMYKMLESLRDDYGLLTTVGKDIDKLLAKARGENEYK